MNIKTIAVIGAGQMGNGIAQVASSAGFQVVLIDMNDALLEKAMATIQFSLGKLVSKEKISQSEADDSIARISTGTDRSLCQNADLVVEAIPEVLEWKLDLFKELDSICPDHTILATNTSSISITKIAGATRRPDRVIGMHFMNPVPLMKLVEIINGEETSAETNATIVQAAESMGKVPLTSEDFPGFISNRILCPMLNEAIFCLQEGVATREAIDGIMKLGMNHPMGPLALADYIGLDTVLHIMDVLYDGFGDSKYRAAPLLRRMVDAGLLGKKTGRGFYTYN
ncbi:MAG: 3-hydroxybutyryl-CoA dehydrogenase [archaeon]|nr:3-hydroxybutyryl-CoA dehydrogenase [archaeon]MDA0842649.1 3-hydroxybutyryl-CoA dehydrogenase [archaeon]MDA1168383.1 3-hydroxybutyryl-CoA dehydrogenase [archaeon]